MHSAWEVKPNPGYLEQVSPQIHMGHFIWGRNSQVCVPEHKGVGVELGKRLYPTPGIVCFVPNGRFKGLQRLHLTRREVLLSAWLHRSLQSASFTDGPHIYQSL